MVKKDSILKGVLILLLFCSCGSRKSEISLLTEELSLANTQIEILQQELTAVQNQLSAAFDQAAYAKMKVQIVSMNKFDHSLLIKTEWSGDKPMGYSRVKGYYLNIEKESPIADDTDTMCDVFIIYDADISITDAVKTISKSDSSMLEGLPEKTLGFTIGLEYLTESEKNIVLKSSATNPVTIVTLFAPPMEFGPLPICFPWAYAAAVIEE